MPEGAAAGNPPPAPPAPSGAGAWEEVRLADLVATVYRRRALVAVFVLVGLLGSAAATVLTPPEYQATATVVPLEQPDLVKNWLESRQAAELVVAQLGPRLHPALGGDGWDEASQTWAGAAPTPSRLANSLLEHVDIQATTLASRGERLVRIDARMPDPVVARDVAAAYLDTLAALRPQLENITRNDAFIKFYDGSNAQEAQRQSEEVARQRTYWLVLDTPLVPSSPSKPQPVLNVSLGVAGGLLLGVLAVFGAEWLSRYRAEFAGRPELALPRAGPGTNGHGSAPAAPAEPAPAAEPPAPPEARGFQVVRGGRTAAAEPAKRAAKPTDPVHRFWKRG